jgi:hypothetical protein
VEQGGARRGRRVEVEERRAGSSSDERFAGDEDRQGMPSYSPPAAVVGCICIRI